MEGGSSNGRSFVGDGLAASVQWCGQEWEDSARL